MKKLFNKQTYIFLSTFVMLSVLRILVFAQDSASATTHTTTTTQESTTTVQPWVWIVGGAVLLLIIVALVRGNSGSKSGGTHTDQVTYTKKNQLRR